MKKNNNKWNLAVILDIMKSQKISKAIIAKKLRVSTQAVSYYFKSAPTIYTAEKLARGLSTRELRIVWWDLILK